MKYKYPISRGVLDIYHGTDIWRPDITHTLDTAIVFPPGAGGNFLVKLLGGNATVRSSNEYDGRHNDWTASNILEHKDITKQVFDSFVDTYFDTTKNYIISHNVNYFLLTKSNVKFNTLYYIERDSDTMWFINAIAFRKHYLDYEKVELPILSSVIIDLVNFCLERPHLFQNLSLTNLRHDIVRVMRIMFTYIIRERKDTRDIINLPGIVYKFYVDLIGHCGINASEEDVIERLGIWLSGKLTNTIESVNTDNMIPSLIEDGKITTAINIKYDEMFFDLNVPSEMGLDRESKLSIYDYSIKNISAVRELLGELPTARKYISMLDQYQERLDIAKNNL